MIELSAFRQNEIANSVSSIVIDRQSKMMSSLRKWSLKALVIISGLPCEALGFSGFGIEYVIDKI